MNCSAVERTANPACCSVSHTPAPKRGTTVKPRSRELTRSLLVQNGEVRLCQAQRFALGLLLTKGREIEMSECARVAVHVHRANKSVARRTVPGRNRVAFIVGNPAAARPGEMPLPRLKARFRQVRYLGHVPRIQGNEVNIIACRGSRLPSPSEIDFGYDHDQQQDQLRRKAAPLALVGRDGKRQGIEIRQAGPGDKDDEQYRATDEEDNDFIAYNMDKNTDTKNGQWSKHRKDPRPNSNATIKRALHLRYRLSSQPNAPGLVQSIAQFRVFDILLG